VKTFCSSAVLRQKAKMPRLLNGVYKKMIKKVALYFGVAEKENIKSAYSFYSKGKQLVFREK
jgi:hypothetical protein